MKKTIAMILILVTMAMMLVGCGNENWGFRRNRRWGRAFQDGGTVKFWI